MPDWIDFWLGKS